MMDTNSSGFVVVAGAVWIAASVFAAPARFYYFIVLIKCVARPSIWTLFTSSPVKSSGS